MTTLFTPETLLRLSMALGVLVAMLLWERYAPMRTLEHPRKKRWLSNLGIGALNRILLQTIPLSSIAIMTSQSTGWGLFNLVEVPLGVSVVVSLLVFDLAIYGQHRLFHAVPLLWRLHRMHHADTDFDTTTGVRFHPLEAVLSMLIKLFVVVCLAPPVIAIVLFELLLNATSFFNHGNVKLPPKVDRWLRKIIVTPDMHRVHHSVYSEETNSNFGFNLPWWDYLLGTYKAQPRDGHSAMQIGLEKFRDAEELHLRRMLTQPFRS